MYKEMSWREKNEQLKAAALIRDGFTLYDTQLSDSDSLCAAKRFYIILSSLFYMKYILILVSVLSENDRTS
jgi:hypothetical protein